MARNKSMGARTGTPGSYAKTSGTASRKTSGSGMGRRAFAANTTVKEETIEEQLSGHLHTLKHDGHLFVVYHNHFAGGLTHHPDCPCLLKEADAK